MTREPLIGARIKRKEDPRLIRGQGQYVADLRLPGMHYVAFVRSPHAHAHIRSIDLAQARSHPGVTAVVTAADLATLCDELPLDSHGEGSNAARTEQHKRPALAANRVRHVGEAIVAVIASSPAAAAEAAATVQIEWELLEPVTDVWQAIEPNAPLLFDDMSSNIQHTQRFQEGDVDTAFARAARIVRQRLVNQRVAGIPLEGRAVAATPDPNTGGVVVWTSTQAAHFHRATLAQVLRLPEHSVRVIAPDVGGGFGVKIGVYPEDVVVAALARHYQRPLCWVETRNEHLIATTQGRGQVADIEAAVDEDGRIHALRLRIIADLGAYSLASFIPDLTAQMAVGVYAIPAVDIEVTCALTNTVPIAAYRGAGRPEAAYYIERLMDLVSYELGIDSIEIRRRNFIPPSAFPYRTPTGLIYDSGNYDQALTKLLELADYQALRAEQQRRWQTDEPLLGIGIACYVEMCGFGPYSYESAVVRADPSGTVTVLTGISPHGQGQHTTFSQIVADMLGVAYDDVVVRHGDTGEVPMGSGTMASRGLALGGGALVHALERLRTKALSIAAHLLGTKPEVVIFDAGLYMVRDAPEQHVTFAQIAAAAYSGQLPAEIEPGLMSSAFFSPPGILYPFGAHLAVVAIDRELGTVRLLNYYAVDDCGPRISPQLAEGQVHGGIAQGVAQALQEAVVYDAQGQPLTTSLMEYALLRAPQLPSFVVDQTVTPTPHNPLGVKGIGEAATIAATPAVANAVLDALRVFNIRHLDMPLQAEKIWVAIEEAMYVTS